jgi:uncharacterized membrane protein YfcA
VDVDAMMVLAGAFIGIVVGLTGMGGGALMTPVLVLFFGVPPLAAVSSDLVVSAVMKPVGAVVHLRRGTVDLRLVGWLCAGSVPSAFCGVLLTRALGTGSAVQDITKMALGIALLLAAGGLIAKAYLSLVARARRRLGVEGVAQAPRSISVRPVPTVLVGVLGGLVVGMTSVGSGSLIIIALLALYPALSAAGLVGTDLVQAVPLVLSAAVGHLLFGDFRLDLTVSLLLGSLPGVYVGARLSARAPGGLVRRALALVLLASGLKLLGAGTTLTGALLAAVVVCGSLAWMAVRRAHGFTPTAWPTRATRTRSDWRGPRVSDGPGPGRVPAGGSAERSTTSEEPR